MLILIGGADQLHLLLIHVHAVAIQTAGFGPSCLKSGLGSFDSLGNRGWGIGTYVSVRLQMRHAVT